MKMDAQLKISKHLTESREDQSGLYYSKAIIKTTQKSSVTILILFGLCVHHLSLKLGMLTSQNITIM